MNIAIVSHFHNAESYICDYFDQVAALQELLQVRGDNLSLVLGHGDCTDATASILNEESSNQFDAYIVDVSHGGKVFGSVVDEQRFKQLAAIGNKLWANIPKSADIIGLVESDLTWTPKTLLRLIDGVLSLSDAVEAPVLLAPMVMGAQHQKSPFYDTWAFRLNGRGFRQQWPYHFMLRNPIEYMEMDSVGSCFFAPAKAVRDLTWPKEDVIVGLCAKAKKQGAKVFLDTKAEVYHL